MIRKKYTFILFNIFFLFSMLTCFGQKKEEVVPPLFTIDENTQLITYQYAIPMKGEPDSLYTRALTWANSYYQNPSQVIKITDTEKKIIECVSNIKITTPSRDGKSQLQAGFVYYNLKIELRQDRYRYTITNFNLRGSANQPIEIWLDKTKPEWSPMRYEHLRQVDEAIQKLIENFETAMEPKPVINDEW